MIRLRDKVKIWGENWWDAQIYDAMSSLTIFIAAGNL